MMEQLINFDKSFLQLFNGSDNVFIDDFVLLLTSGFTWIPLYLALLYLIIKNNDAWNKIFLIILSVGLCMLISNGFNGGVIKPFIGRVRPSLDPDLITDLQLVRNYTGSGFSFFSAHACNTFAIAIFFSLLVRSKLLSFFLIGWAMLNSWTRLYLGVHYPLDVVVGMLMGSLISVFIYGGYMRISKKFTPTMPFISSQYTPSGYNFSDVDIIITVFIFTLLYCIIRAVIQLGFL